MKKILILFVGLSFLSFKDHKYYLALTEIEYSSKSNSVQMIMNVFMDDIEKAIEKEQGVNLKLTTNKEIANADGYLFNYLQENFILKINDSKVDFNFVGKEYEGNIVYFYLEVENVTKINSLHIENNVLIAHFPDQQNLIKVKINNTKKSLFLTKENNKGLLNY
ncbi:hypothetical protein BTO06_08470 [Tenacibaculum sp. SZ-18]|uniref:DUF6702 family protein n=1 Tax=Tenacibaculum sp. SZ-18 TaxID=754423 RepID=UPI000C2D4994|nr:DUF6702 family protein [Tenacibaculum sp. SZ-18]AUC15170.1 hypothetical protein BTO06_08470 [Tenacibaculum sp. SZ-18]